MFTRLFFISQARSHRINRGNWEQQIARNSKLQTFISKLISVV